MRYTIILTEKSEGGIHVSVPALPDCAIEAGNRDEAISLAREAISKIVSRSEILSIDIPYQPKVAATRDDTPWEWFGKAEGDSSWDMLFDEIEQQRDSTRK